MHFATRFPSVLLVLVTLLSVASRVHAQCETQKVIPEFPGGGDQFGDAVAISGDLAVIGASRADLHGSNSGAAYVFRYLPDEMGTWQWREEARLLAPDGAPNDLFGWSVAVDGFAAAGEVIVIGAYLDDHEAGSNAGSVHVFRSSFDGEIWTWSHETTIKADDGLAGDEYGQSVAVDDDVLVVGSPRHDEVDTNTGSIYVYAFDDVEWQLEVELGAADAMAQDLFGTSVAISGDVILVGTPFTDQAGLNSGAAYPFRYVAPDWVAEPKLEADDASAGDKFGQSVALHGGVAVVGAFLDDDGADNTGSVYVFRDDGGWILRTKLHASDAGMDDQFGRAVGVYDGLGDDDIIVAGAALTDLYGSASGSAYVYLYDGVDWIETPPLLATDGAANDQFGISVAVGERFVLVGASRADDPDAGVNAGATYVFTNGVEVLTDCNGNGESDFCDVARGTSEDCDANGIPDECDLEDPENDVNDNGVLDVCEDCNDNGIPDPCDIDEGREEDCNANGIPDFCDIRDGTSEDVNEDGVPDECFADCNKNGIDDLEDIAEGTSQDCNANMVPDECDLLDGTSLDCNENGVPDECDIEGGESGDCDENGVPDECEDCNENGRSDACDIADGTSLDLNDDGIPDECQDCDGNEIPDFVEILLDPDLDCNANGVLDACEVENGGICTEECVPDCNANGIPDSCDVESGFSEDVDANGVPDECEDCNGNGVPDGLDISAGDSQDCNANGLPDECEIDEDTEGGEYYCTEACDPDCNVNGIPDECDIADGNSDDCDLNGVPDECDPDCNDNGFADACDIAEGRSGDFNDNGIPDECEPDCDDDGLPDFLEILLGLEEDCQPNGVPDSCDIESGNSSDDDGNGVPDECDGVTCFGDINHDGKVDFGDVILVLTAWGSCPGCPEDLSDDGRVDFEDVLLILTAWGPC